jgi:hypothetical protein
MSDRPSAASPATQFHDVVIAHDQTGARWHARQGEIRRGRVCILDSAPAGFLGRVGSTFTITAVDGAGRTRLFASLSLAEATPGEVLFA